MYENLVDIIKLATVFILFLILLFIRYKHPHFSMHFLNGISGFTINSFDYDRKCTRHSREDIERYKRRQFIYLVVMLIFSVVSIITYAYVKMK